MIITKKHLPRRTFLRGVGATLALPLLDSMVPALSATAKTSANPVQRLGFIYFPHGSVTWAPGGQNQWTPAGEGGALELSPILQQLAPVKDQMLVLTNMEHKNAQGNGTDGNAEHTRSNASWLSAARPKMTEGADVRLATTVDQIAARQLCRDTRLPSLELTLENSFLVGNCDNGYNCVYVNSLSWSSPNTPLPMENNPRMVFERLFGDGGTVDERRAELRRDRSILDSVTEDMARLVGSLGASDRSRLDEYVDAVREVERRIQRAEEQAIEATFALPDRPVGIPETYDEHAKLLFDLLLLTYQADITRVFSLQLGREQSARTFPWIGVSDGHHAVSHHQDNPEKIASIAKINAYHIQLLSYFIEKMATTPDGDGSLLDHSMVLHGSGMSNGNLHDHKNLPLVLLGGGAGRLRGGRHIKFAELTPMANLLLGLLDKAGVPAESFGDSTGRVDLEPLSLTSDG
ncbi:MAG: DUF1552 domain-containing protein [Acidobacteriota bacterium]|nr:DUF1552 domain-containing protein [Acidobacteriota bacterium]